MKQIHWFPGHMKKAQIDIEEKVKIVDLIIELLDARIPLSSRNPTLFKLTQNKKRLVVLTKNDLADPLMTQRWIEHFKNGGFAAIFADLNQEKDIKNIIKPNLKSSCRRWSTLINKIAKRNAASVQNKPGHTKSQQWINVSDKFQLLDTPGVLPSNYENKDDALNLALVGSINEEILPLEQLAEYSFNYLKEFYPNLLTSRFDYLNLNDDFMTSLTLIAKKRGYFTKDGLDLYKSQKVFLNELKNGILGQISFERI